MKVLRDLTFGLLSALASGIIVLGALSLALVEGMAILPPPAADPVIPTLIIQVQAEQPTIKLPSLEEVTPVASTTPTSSATPLPLTNVCPPPTGWVAYVIEPGDTVEQLARLHRITPQTLRDANCLSSDMLLPAYILYLPALPPTSTPVVIPPTMTAVPCGPPWSWVPYIVRPGDTLFKLSLAYGVSVPQIQFANCMGTSTYIRYGQTLYLPYFIPINTPFPTATKTFTPTATTAVPTGIIITPTITRTTPPTFTFTPLPTLTLTPTLAPSATFTATQTPLPTATFTATPTPLPPTETLTPPPETSEEGSP
jgi:LysM repeat protein